MLELVNPDFRTHPEGPVPIFVNSPDAIAGKSVAGAINDELAILQAIQAQIGGNPDAAFPSFSNRTDGVVGKTFIRGVEGEDTILQVQQAAAIRANPQTSIFGGAKRLDPDPSSLFHAGCRLLIEVGDGNSIKSKQSAECSNPEVAVACLGHDHPVAIGQAIIRAPNCMDVLSDGFVRIQRLSTAYERKQSGQSKWKSPPAQGRPMGKIG